MFREKQNVFYRHFGVPVRLEGRTGTPFVETRTISEDAVLEHEGSSRAAQASFQPQVTVAQEVGCDYGEGDFVEYQEKGQTVRRRILDDLSDETQITFILEE